MQIKKFRGGFESQCTEGYIGPLCGTCEPGLSKLGNSCYKCQNEVINLLVVFSLMSLLCVGFFILVW